MSVQITPKYGAYKSYRNKREYARKVRQLECLLVWLESEMHPEIIGKTIWKHVKPVTRAHDPYARIGFISFKVYITN